MYALMYMFCAVYTIHPYLNETLNHQHDTVQVGIHQVSLGREPRAPSVLASTAATLSSAGGCPVAKPMCSSSSCMFNGWPSDHLNCKTAVNPFFFSLKSSEEHSRRVRLRDSHLKEHSTHIFFFFFLGKKDS